MPDVAAPQPWQPLSSVWGSNTASPSSVRSPSPEIRVGENGHIHGVDGMLDQIASALTKHAGPMLVRDVLPAVQNDVQMQGRVGQAAGEAMAQQLRPWIIAGVGALGILAAIGVVRLLQQR